MDKKIILLVRHGIAEGKLGPKPDYDRELIEEGRRGVDTNAKKYSDYLTQVECVYCSGSLRTRQTLEVLTPYLNPQGYGVIFNDHIYDKEVYWGDVLDLITSTPDDINCVALVGHSPSISELYAYLSPQNAYSLERGDIVMIVVEKKWKDL